MFPSLGDNIMIFNIFRKESPERRALNHRLASAKRALVRAMKIHGINSDRAREFDKLIDKLEAELAHA
jgi:hypothetical protein